MFRMFTDMPKKTYQISQGEDAFWGCHSSKIAWYKPLDACGLGSISKRNLSRQLGSVDAGNEDIDVFE